MLKNYTLTFLLLWLTYPALAQQPLFDYRKEFPIQTFATIKPGMRYIMESSSPNEPGMMPKLRRVVTKPDGPMPGGLVPTEPLRTTIFTFVKFVPVTVGNGRSQLFAVFNSSAGQYGVLIDYSMEMATKLLARLGEYFINVDEVAKAKKLLEGKIIYPIVHYAIFDKGGDQRTDYTFMKKMVPVKVTKVTYGTKYDPIRVSFTYPDGEESTRNYHISRENKPIHELASLNSHLMGAFALSDPRLDNGRIKEPVWKAIQKGFPQKGMTTKECRLAMGKPKEQVDSMEKELTTT